MKGKTRTGEKARGPLGTHGKQDFSVPSPPTLKLWQGQQQRFKKDTQHLSLPLFFSLSFQTHSHTQTLSFTEAQTDMLSQTHTHATPSFPQPPPCSLGAQCPPHPSFCSLNSSSVPLPLIFLAGLLSYPSHSSQQTF